MSDKVYTIRVHDEGKEGLWAEVLELPGCFASGFTLPELYESLEEAMSLYLSDETDQVTVKFSQVEHRNDWIDERRKFSLAPA